MMNVVVREEKIEKLQNKLQSQRNHIGMLERKLEEERASKADHVFRLRTILIGALNNHAGWRSKAERELGVRNAGE